MNEPDFIHRSDLPHYLEWARENKKRADRLLAAAQALGKDPYDMPGAQNETWVEFLAAMVDYEDRIG